MQVTATWATDRKRFSRALGPGSIKIPFALTPSSLFPVTISKLVLSPPYLLNSPASVFFFFFFFSTPWIRSFLENSAQQRALYRAGAACAYRKNGKVIGYFFPLGSGTESVTCTLEYFSPSLNLCSIDSTH